MESPFYQYTTYWVLFVDLVVALATLWLFNSAKASKQQKLIIAVAFTLLIGTMHWLFGGQHLLPTNLSGLTFYLIILGVAMLAVGMLEVSFSTVMQNLAQTHLQIVQGLRVFVGAGFLMEGVLAVIPGWFSILDGYFHISSGFLALLAAVIWQQNKSQARPLLWLANLVGLADIMVIVTGICFWVWEDLGPYHNMHYVVFGAGPILLWIHYHSIKKLLTPRAL